MRQLSWVVVSVVCGLLPFGAVAAPGWMSARAAEDGLLWEPHPVTGPKSPAQVGALEEIGQQASLRGAVEVGPEQGAVLWLDALQVVRVTANAPELRFVRIPASDERSESRIELDEPGIPVREGTWYLAEPMGEGSAWIVLAPKRARVQVEHPRYGRNAQDEEAVRLSILRWIEGDGPLPLLPFHPELRGRLEADAETAALLGAQAGEDLWLHAATTAWRKASAMQAWMLTHALDRTMFRVSSLQPPGEQIAIDGFSPHYTQFAAPQDAWTFEVEGPGVLVVEGRALLRHPREEDRTLEVLEAGRVLAEETLAGRASLDRIGFEGELRIPLGRGKRTLTLRTSGSSLVRVRRAERRPWLADVLRGQVEWSDWARDAEEALQGADTGVALALRQLIAAVEGAGPALKPEETRKLEGLPPLLRAHVLARAAESTSDLSRRAELASSAAEALEEAGRPGTPLAWEVAVTTSRVLADTGRGVQARRLLASMDALPESGWALAQAAEVIRHLPLGAPVRSRELAALELAWRKEPLSQEIRRRYRRTFWRHSRWTLTHPLGEDGLPPPPAAEFVDLATSTPGPGAHWLLRPGDPAQIAVNTVPGGAATLRAFVLPAPETTKPIALHVDGVRIPVRPLAGVERIELALEDGLHDLRLEAPPGTRAFVSHRPRAASPEPEEIAYLRRGWPVRSRGKPVHFRIPEANLPNPIRLSLRVATAAREPVTLWVRTDVGPARRLILRPQRSSALHFRLERDGEHSAPAEAVLTLPALTRQVWIDPEGDVPVFASVSVRSGLSQSVKVQAPDPLDAKVLEKLLTLSRDLQSSPENAELRLERAALLQALGEEELARDDVEPLFQIRSALSEAQVRRLADVVGRLEDPDGSAVRIRRSFSRVEVLLPAYAALVATHGEHSDEAARYLEARRRAFRGEHADAALELVKLYRDLHSPQLALEALGQLEQVQGDAERWPGFAAPLGSALAEELTAWADLPRLSRMRRLTSRWARWDSLRGAEESAGFARAVTTTPELELNGDAVRMAWLAPPWPLADARLLRSGYASVLDLHLDQPTRFGADVTCGSVNGTRQRGGCALALRVDGRTVARERVGIGEIARLRTGELEAGPHQIEVTLANDNPLAVAVARFAAEHGEDAQTVMPGQPLSMLRALPEKPVVVVVQGPAALRIGARAAVPGEAQAVALETTAPDGVKRKQREIVLAAEADPTVQGAGLGAESQFVVLLPEAGVHRVRLDTRGGEALLRVRLATARDGRRPHDDWEGRSAALEPLQWPSMNPPLALLPTGVGLGDGGWSLGMVSARLLAEHENLDENDDTEEQALRFGAMAGLALRRELAAGRAWGRIEGIVRVPTDSLAPAYGLRAGLHAKGLPLDLRAQLYASGYTQALEDGRGWRVYGRARLDRWIPLTSDLSLIPAVALSFQRQSAGDVADPDLFARSVFSRYGEHHPLRLQSMTSLRWAPVLDHVGWLRAGAISNADLASLDNVGGELGWASLLGRSGVRTHAAYGASWRFQDAHRSQGWLRHELTAGADWPAWSTANGRLLLFGDGRALLSTRFGFEALASVGVRWDFSGGRGLRDVSPYEEEFEALHSPRRSTD